MPFITEISANGLISVSSVEVLLSGFGSGVVELIVAVFIIVPTAVWLTVPLIIILLISPASKVPILRFPFHGWKVTPPSNEYSGFKITSGISSVKTILCAADGPKFVTVIV